MALSIRDVQSVAGTGVGGLALPAFASDPIPGDTVVVFTAIYVQSGALVAPTDNKGNTYSLLGSFKQSVGNPNSGLAMWASVGVTGGSSFVVTGHINTANDNNLHIAWCLTGGQMSYPLDWVQSHGGGGASQTVGPTIVAPGTNAIMLGGHYQDGSTNTATPAAGWNTTGVNGFDAGMNTRAALANGGSVIKISTAYKVVSAVSSLAWTCTVSFDWTGMLASIAPSTAVGNGLFFMV